MSGAMDSCNQALDFWCEKIKALIIDSSTTVGRECQPFWRELK